jgi:hypothetical protein
LPYLARVNENDPPIIPGSLSVRLDMQGRLIRFSAMPSQFDVGRSHSPQPDKDNWVGLFSAAGIDAARLAPTEPKLTPPSAFDARAAWVGTFPEQPGLEMRVEAAAWRGRPVYFEIIGPWVMPERGTTVQGANPMMVWTISITDIAMILLGGMLAWRNWRLGRSDRKGAFRLMVFVFLGFFIATQVGSGVNRNNLGFCFLTTSFVWILYLGLEPYVRRRWPITLISWSRLLAGRFRDPLVGRDALFGILISIVLYFIFTLFRNISPDPLAFLRIRETLLIGLNGMRPAAGNIALLAVWPVVLALVLLFVLFLLRLLARRDWLAVVFFMLVFVPGVYTENWRFVLPILQNGLIAVVMMRYGLVAVAVFYFTGIALIHFPVTLNFSVWYAGIGLAPLVAVLALAVFAFYTSLGGQKVFQGSLLED